MKENLILKKSFYKKIKAISPLIATILLIVVAVAIIGIIVSWGKGFTTDSLQEVTSVTDLKTNDATSFIFRPELKGDLLTFTYSPPSNLQNKTIDINAYTVVGSDNIKYLSSPVTLKEGTVGITGVNIASYDVSGRQVDLVLITTKNEIIGVNKTNYTEAVVDLPYVMFNKSRLYIHTTDAPTSLTWDNAVSYCADMNSEVGLGYDDWYLPDMPQMAAIWIACPDQDKSNTCMNTTIQNKITGWSAIISEYYWTSTDYSSSGAYTIDMVYGVIVDDDKSYNESVRCVRDH
jgi:FlaG/FlaF family flagellin (archaellin)